MEYPIFRLVNGKECPCGWTKMLECPQAGLSFRHNGERYKIVAVYADHVVVE